MNDKTSRAIKYVSMKQEHLFFIAACCLALGIFALSHSLHGVRNPAYASVLSGMIRDPARPTSIPGLLRLRHDILSAPDALLDLSGSSIQAIFKKPELIRNDLPTVIWQYRSQSCVLDLYFTAAGQDVKASPVVHYEIRERNPKNKRSDKDLRQSCAQSLLAS